MDAIPATAGYHTATEGSGLSGCRLDLPEDALGVTVKDLRHLRATGAVVGLGGPPMTGERVVRHAPEEAGM